MKQYTNLYDNMVHSRFKKLSASADIDFEILDKRIEFELDTHGNKIQYFNVTSNYVDRFIASLGEYSRHFYTSFVQSVLCMILYIHKSIKTIKWTYKTADVGIHTGGVTGSIPVPPTIF